MVIILMRRLKNKTLDEKIIFFAAQAVVVLSVISIFLLIFHKELHSLTFPEEKKLRLNRTFSILSDIMPYDDSLQKYNINANENHDLMFEISSAFDLSSLSCNENAAAQKFSFSINGFTEEYFDENNIFGNRDFLHDLTYSSKGDLGTADFQMNDLYLVKYSFDGPYLCFDFFKPSEIFDRIIVIDSACGGDDLGTVKGDILEKDINLSILIKIKQDFESNNMLSDGFPKEIHGVSAVNVNGIKTGIFYTRTEDIDVSFDERIELVNRLNPDCFISIRMNSTASGRMSEIKGAEVMYRVSDANGSSKLLADKVLWNLLSSLGSNSKGTVAGDEDKLISETKSPICIVLPGFMTNQEELDLLSTDDYQQKIADAVYEALIQ